MWVSNLNIERNIHLTKRTSGGRKLKALINDCGTKPLGIKNKMTKGLEVEILSISTSI